MAWLGDARLKMMGRLRYARRQATTAGTTCLGMGVRNFFLSFKILSSSCMSITCFRESSENKPARNLSSKYQIEGAIVNQFRKLKFPVVMRTNWKMICQQPLNIQADLVGMNVKKGNTSSMTWFPKVSNLCHPSGAW